MSGLPALVVPLIEEPTDDELERRQRLADRARELREAIRAETGPLQIPADMLKHEAREEESE
jgi:hypothetical protein